MGCPISPLIAHLFIEEFEVKALSSAPHPPHLWLRYVDNTFVIQEAEHSQQLLQLINTQDPHIQFTMEEPDQEGISTIPRHHGFSRLKQYPQYFSLQKAHTHRPISNTGTVITSSQQNIVFSTPWHTGAM